MELVGDILKREREKKNLSLSDISRETKILKRHLKQIEDNDFTSLTGQVYIDGFIRLYAAEVGIDPNRFIGLYQDHDLLGTDFSSKNKKGDFEWRYLIIAIQVVIFILVLLYE